MKKTSGFSLIELLISMGILGILLTILSNFLISNQNVTRDQITQVTLENDTKLAFLRMSEVISQAQYIFPAGQTLILNGKIIVTGSQAIAVLVPAATTYCQNSASQTYCGYAYTVEDRTPFNAILGSNQGTSGQALIETFVQNLEWDKNIIPAESVSLFTWNSGGTNNFRRSPITDAINPAATNLMLSAKMATYSDFDIPEPPAKFNFISSDTSKSLILAVESQIMLQRNVKGNELKLERSNFVFSRAIPRSKLPD